MSTYQYSRPYTQRFRDYNGGDTYQDRHIIGRDTAISGGVYYGLYGGEAIVVDVDKYPMDFTLLYTDSLYHLGDKNPAEARPQQILEAVYDTVRERMQYSQERVDWLLKRIANKEGRSQFIDGSKVALNSFIHMGAGVCRHQALTCGALLEMYTSKGLLKGDVSVERSMRWAPNGDPEGHAWLRYTDTEGEVYILDVAQNYFGKMSDADIYNGWNYARDYEQEDVTTVDIRKMKFLTWWQAVKKHFSIMEGDH